MSMVDTLVNLAASLVGGGTSGGFLLWMFRHKIGKDTRQIASLKREVALLKDEKVATLEKQISSAEKKITGVQDRLEEHEKTDRSQEILATLKILSGDVRDLTNKVSRALERNSGQDAELKSLRHDVNRVSDDLREQRRICASLPKGKINDDR